MSEQWPLPTFHFSIVIGGSMDDAAFQEVTGIQTQIETQEYQEGGSNLVYHLPQFIKYSNLTLKRGIADSQSALMKWCQNTLESQLNKPIKTKTVTVRLLDADGSPCRIWEFHNVYPVKWNVNEFHATKNEVAIEEIELCYSRTKRTL
ncbi:phage tail protein [Marinomonas sp. TI.3.20]|uniref:phage tail protein n=1 Tax=Marinomonas sp. TI.3.20 TaxID=3121296 RepID=UPI00311F4C92